MAVVVQNDVAVASVELAVGGRVHGHLVGTFNSPDLQRQSRGQTLQCALCHPGRAGDPRIVDSVETRTSFSWECGVIQAQAKLNNLRDTRSP